MVPPSPQCLHMDALGQLGGFFLCPQCGQGRPLAFITNLRASAQMPWSPICCLVSWGSYSLVQFFQASAWSPPLREGPLLPGCHLWQLCPPGSVLRASWDHRTQQALFRLSSKSPTQWGMDLRVGRQEPQVHCTHTHTMSSPVSQELVTPSHKT